jgi:hypothetical protein
MQIPSQSFHRIFDDASFVALGRPQISEFHEFRDHLG